MAGLWTRLELSAWRKVPSSTSTSRVWPPPLMPPLFDPKMDDAPNYGNTGIGSFAIGSKKVSHSSTRWGGLTDHDDHTGRLRATNAFAPISAVTTTGS